AMMGMSSGEWARYLHDRAGVPDEPDAINAEVVQRMLAAYREHLPLVPGAVAAVRRLAERFPLGLASSSNRPLIDTVLDLAGLTELFRATVSSEEVARGKPAPDVYVETAHRLGVAPERCAAIEDSHAGIRSAHAAGMRVIVVPNASYPPGDDALALADAVIASLDELTPDEIGGTQGSPEGPLLP
ncbi:MAG TPA: HAD family phosphatase, partial [Gaiellaceae bacterium]|nr:HAD family phosphatase [Gaiellaceae bacterium]